MYIGRTKPKTVLNSFCNPPKLRNHNLPLQNKIITLMDISDSSSDDDSCGVVVSTAPAIRRKQKANVPTMMKEGPRASLASATERLFINNLTMGYGYNATLPGVQNPIENLWDHLPDGTKMVYAEKLLVANFYDENAVPTLDVDCGVPLPEVCLDYLRNMPVEEKTKEDDDDDDVGVAYNWATLMDEIYTEKSEDHTRYIDSMACDDGEDDRDYQHRTMWHPFVRNGVIPISVVPDAANSMPDLAKKLFDDNLRIGYGVLTPYDFMWRMAPKAVKSRCIMTVLLCSFYGSTSTGTFHADGGELTENLEKTFIYGLTRFTSYKK